MKRWEALASCMICLYVFAFAGCGKKGPLSLPKVVMPFAVTQLTAELEDSTVFFRGKIVGQKGQEVSLQDIVGCRIYHTRYAADNPPCEACPIEYQLYKEIKGEVIEDENFFCRVACPKKEGLHFFRIRLIGPDNSVGPPSNMAKIDLYH